MHGSSLAPANGAQATKEGGEAGTAGEAAASTLGPPPPRTAHQPSARRAWSPASVPPRSHKAAAGFAAVRAATSPPQTVAMVQQRLMEKRLMCVWSFSGDSTHPPWPRAGRCGPHKTDEQARDVALLSALVPASLYRSSLSAAHWRGAQATDAIGSGEAGAAAGAAGAARRDHRCRRAAGSADGAGTRRDRC